MYDESIRYYVRALAMNPKADNAWQYLRISLRYDFNSSRYINNDKLNGYLTEASMIKTINVNFLKFNVKFIFPQLELLLPIFQLRF
jgi:tetratricopeptide (TPR) repeat protein